MADIEFVDPPAQGRRIKHPHAAIVQALKARPGTWARVITDAPHSITDRMTRGELKPYRPVGSFEATARKNGDRWDIYARYVGENGEHR
jgi:hypothetical protein